MLICCTDRWWRVICVLDAVNHAVLRRFHIAWICDLHDHYLLDDWGRDLDTKSKRDA